MRNFIILVLLLNLFCSNIFANGVEIDTLSSCNLIKIGVFKDEAPYAFIDDNGQLDGFSIDIIKAIMNKAELDYQFDVYDRNRDYDKSHLIADSLLKKSDVGVSFVPNMELKKRYYFSDPYTILAFKIIAPDTIAYGGMRDLYNKDIIVKRGSSAHGQIIHFGVPFFNSIVLVNDAHTGLKLLSEGVGEFLICDDVTYSHFVDYLKANKMSAYNSSLPTIEVACISNNRVLINIINNSLQKIKDSGEYEAIYNKWFKVNNNREIIRYLFIALTVLSLLAIIFMIISLLLKKQINKSFNKISGAYKKVSELNEELNRYNADLQNKEEQLKTILDKLPIPIYIKNPITQQHVYLNEESKKNFGDSVNTTSIELVSEIDAEEYKRIDEKILRTGKEYIANEVLFFRNGKTLDTYVRKTLIDYNGEKHILVVRLNLTEQRKSQMTNKLLSSSLSSIKAYTWSVDCRTNTISFGQMYMKTHINLQEITVGKFIEMVHPDDKEAYSAVLYGMKDKGSGEYNMRYRIDIEEKGDYQWWETRAIVETIIDNVNGDYVVFYGIDLNINEIQEAKQKAEQSEKLKMAFLANMSHEIRTPLNAIVGFSQLMQYTTDQDEIKQYVEIINNNNQLLLTLIEDILDLSKIESGSVVIKKDNININDIMQELFTMFTPKCKGGVQLKKNIKFDYLIIKQDRTRLMQILSNFISNSIKYTEQGEIEIGAEIIENRVKFYVKDTGIGIEEKKHPLVFERFEKLDSFAQGTGLGLAICKALTEAMGGEIGFESLKDNGSTFWVYFSI